MPPRTLATLAHALTIAATPDAALQALGDALAELDRDAHLGLVFYDGRTGMLRERLLLIKQTSGDRIVERTSLDTTLDHLSTRDRLPIMGGGRLVDLGATSDELAGLFQLPGFGEPGWLSARGMRFDHELTAVLVLYETRKLFGARTSERFAPSIALFDLALARLLEREARNEAVETLETVTQRVHEEYDRRLAELQQRLSGGVSAAGTADDLLDLERQLSAAVEQARQATRRADAVDATVSTAVEELEKAHVELHRRGEQLREKSRTLYLIDRVLTLDATAGDPRQLADGLLALVGDDMHAQRCSLMLRTPDGESLYIAAARGLAPVAVEGTRVPIGQGVAGRVAASRTPVLVRDVAEARQHPLLHDQYFTTGSFISFPLVYHDELLGVLNLANRAMHGVFGEEDVDRVRLLALVTALVAGHARLPERLIEALSVR
jgi:hypothetical protein